MYQNGCFLNKKNLDDFKELQLRYAYIRCTLNVYSPSRSKRQAHITFPQKIIRKFPKEIISPGVFKNYNPILPSRDFFEFHACFPSKSGVRYRTSNLICKQFMGDTSFFALQYLWWFSCLVNHCVVWTVKNNISFSVFFSFIFARRKVSSYEFKVFYFHYNDSPCLFLSSHY